MSAGALLADAVLVLHAAVIVFVVGVQALVMAGGVLGWRWVRNLALRAVHLALIVFVTTQAWLGELCPLTVWEWELRRAAGQAVSGDSFVAHWVHRIFFFHAPEWAFALAYTGFGLVVVASWWRWPPRRRRG